MKPQNGQPTLSKSQKPRNPRNLKPKALPVGPNPTRIPSLYLPLVRKEWKNGSNCSCNCTPFLHSLLTKGKYRVRPNIIRPLPRPARPLPCQQMTYSHLRHPKPSTLTPKPLDPKPLNPKPLNPNLNPNP